VDWKARTFESRQLYRRVRQRVTTPGASRQNSQVPPPFRCPPVRLLPRWTQRRSTRGVVEPALVICFTDRALPDI